MEKVNTNSARKTRLLIAEIRILVKHKQVEPTKFNPIKIMWNKRSIAN